MTNSYMNDPVRTQQRNRDDQHGPERVDRPPTCLNRLESIGTGPGDPSESRLGVEIVEKENDPYYPIEHTVPDLQTQGNFNYDFGIGTLQCHNPSPRKSSINLILPLREHLANYGNIILCPLERRRGTRGDSLVSYFSLSRRSVLHLKMLRPRRSWSQNPKGLSTGHSLFKDHKFDGPDVIKRMSWDFTDSITRTR